MSAFNPGDRGQHLAALQARMERAFEDALYAAIADTHADIMLAETDFDAGLRALVIEDARERGES